MKFLRSKNTIALYILPETLIGSQSSSSPAVAQVGTYFLLKERRSKFTTELRAGTVTFLTVSTPSTPSTPRHQTIIAWTA